ncbi:cerebellar degeneration-related protein 2 isoform X2 [Bacillus rossius redtenbacheri]|uniref:cerebellar degeneration-related protein 2 isoform X2 n=1 Tax=Bacillus rossius redtenbacheri TaxID=93214 RepID=UPI002FDE9D8E
MDILLPFDESDERSMLEDLQLAAELGKTLLERNKELEGCIKQQGGVIEDQAQEIEYLTKQTAALREVNDSRLRIYEQLEVSIQDLERANQRLVLENVSDKKHIKSLCVTIDTLEARCEELQAAVQGLQAVQRCDKQDQAVQHRCTDLPQVGDADQVSGLQGKLQDLTQQRSRDRTKLLELEEQLAAALQENSKLEDQLSLLRHKQEEVLTGDELRRGYVCPRCLKKMGLVDDNMSVANSTSSDAQSSAVMQQIWDSQDENASVDMAYQNLMEQYEALLKMQQGSPAKQQSTGENCLSLQDELRLSGDFNSFNSKNETEGSSNSLDHQENVGKVNGFTKNKVHKAFSGTPTEFSEAETSSSGFSDEISNKATQTEKYLPGYFLCSVADGDDCRISIYDDINPVESRFRKTPEYKQLFREIFAVLKRAAEEKTECEQAAALNSAPAVSSQAAAAEPMPKAEEKPPSAVQQSKRSQDNTRAKTTPKLPVKDVLVDKDAPTDKDAPSLPNGEDRCGPQNDGNPVVQRNTDSPKPKHDILEYLALGSGRKKSHSRKNSPAKGPRGVEKVERMEAMAAVGSCVARLQAGSNRQGGRRRRDTRVFENQNYARDRSVQKVESWDFQPQPFVSAASQEVAKLRRLEKSYAEVLRLGPKNPNPRPPYNNSYRC